MRTFNIGPVTITWLGHSSFRIQGKEKTIYIDPYILDNDAKQADYIFITHEHYDHCATDNIKKIMGLGTFIISPPSCVSNLSFAKPNQMRLLEAGKSTEHYGLKVLAVPAYNIGKPFHTPRTGIGFVFEVDGVKIYHAGDTDKIPEMSKLAGLMINVALLPVGGKFTMNAHEAADAVKLIRPKVAIQMHWGSIIGSINDAEEFKRLVGKAAQVVILS